MQDADYTYNGEPVTLKSTTGGYAVIALPSPDGRTNERLVPVESLKPTFTIKDSIEFVAHLDPAPLPRPITHMDVVKALNGRITALEAELEKERAQRNPRIPFYTMVNTLDLHRDLLNAAQGDNAAQVHVIALIVRALELYVATLAGDES